MKTGSKGLFESIEEQGRIKEGKKENSLESKNLGSEKLSVKRSYSLRELTIKRLQELKVFVYPDPNITYNEIVDEAINLLYDQKQGEKKEKV
jgi:hypothetical protein